MLEIILVGSAVLILVLAGVFLARGYKKDKKNNNINNINNSDIKNIKDQENLKTDDFQTNSRLFETKYDELVFLYKTGAINEEEYNEQIKNVIN